MLLNNDTKYDVLLALQDIGNAFIAANSKQRYYNGVFTTTDDKDYPVALRDEFTGLELKFPNNTSITQFALKQNQVFKNSTDERMEIYRFTCDNPVFDESIMCMPATNEELQKMLLQLIKERFNEIKQDLSLEEAQDIYFYSKLESKLSESVNVFEDNDLVLFEGCNNVAFISVSIEELRATALRGDGFRLCIQSDKTFASFSLDELKTFKVQYDKTRQKYFNYLDDLEVNGEDVTVYPYYEEYLKYKEQLIVGQSVL